MTGRANIAVIGAGWWSQGWHLPCLQHNENADVVAIVDTSPHPKSNLNPDLDAMVALEEKYGSPIYSSVDEMLKEIGSTLDGVVIATPHSTHYDVCKQFMDELDRRHKIGESRPLHILLEKPMSTDVHQAIELYKLAKNHPGDSKFWINHSANYRVQSKIAKEAIQSGRIGRIRHVTAYFASPLKWIFEDPANKGWNEPTEGMLGNGFAWGQSSHIFSFLYHICPNLKPIDVFCTMTHSKITGADVSHSATIRCSDGTDDEFAVVSVSGTSLLPGNAHSKPPVPKKAQIEVYGERGSLHYEGNDRDPSSGRLELRNEDGHIDVLHDQFHFENLENEGCGPESLQNFVQLCCGNANVYTGCDFVDGLRSIQTIDAMYRSHFSRSVEKVTAPQ